MSGNNHNGNQTREVIHAKSLKIVVVGDGTVGKTCLLISYTSNSFPVEYIPTVFDNYAGSIKVEGVDYNLTLWDTAGQEEYERLRPLTYPGTDCFLLCYAVDNRNSLENVMTKWYPELKHHCPRAPIVLIGTKTDLRSETPPEKVISANEGRKLKSQIKAAKYVECSAKTRDGLVEVFEEAIRAIVKPKTQKPKLRQCRIL